MKSVVSRAKASLSLSSEAYTADLLHILKAFTWLPSDDKSKQSVFDIQKKLHAAHELRQFILDETASGCVQEVFRHLGGFQAILTTLDTISKLSLTGNSESDSARPLLDLLQATINVLAASLRAHKGNQKFFKYGLAKGGWSVLKKKFQEMIEKLYEKESRMSQQIAERLFGCLLSCAVDDEMLLDFFGKLKRRVQEAHNRHNSTLDIHALKTSPSVNRLLKSEGKQNDTTRIIWGVATEEISSSALVQIPDLLVVMLELWKTLNELDSNSKEVGDEAFFAISLGVPCVINHVGATSIHNLVALHGTEMLSLLLRHLSFPMSAIQTKFTWNLATTLLQLGIPNLDDAYFLFRTATFSPITSDLLLSSLNLSYYVPYVNFDLSLHGFASVELPDIGRSFPPVSSSGGYTISLWIQIVRFDAAAHTTVFGAFDPSQTCFVLVYLEKDTHNLILQTSVKSSRPSVRFKSISFKQSQWYHIVIVHRRPKLTYSSRASLFVNGEFIEQLKSHYPVSPPLNIANDRSSASTSTARNSNSVQMFLGTPHDLAARLGRGLVFSQWQLASAHLFGDTLSDDLIAVYHQLGPRYSGNYQDCLGSFQTYQASAALNLRNEGLHPDKEEKSDIVTAIRSKASDLVPESDVLLNISPAAIFSESHYSTYRMPFSGSLSKAAAKNLRVMLRGGTNSFAINGSIPSLNEALLRQSSFAVLAGDPAVVVPQSLDDAAWRVGGCTAVGLSLLDTAVTGHAIVKALKITLKMVEENWRNSEAMERENGFGALATLLATKLALHNDSSEKKDPVQKSGDDLYQDKSPAFDVLLVILEFVGYRVERPQDSVINNPLAYRVLIVDTDIWRSAALPVQKLYYEQFAVFGVKSNYHQFNTKRLIRMRIIKKWLDALKEETFTTGAFAYFIEAFEFLLDANLCAESLRAVALYITYAIYKPEVNSSHQMRSARSMDQKKDGSARRATLSGFSPSPVRKMDDGTPVLTHVQIAVRLLSMYSNLLCRYDDTVTIKKFARAVTNKWLLHLLADQETSAVILASKILARLLVINGRGYIRKFSEKSGGMTILQHQLQHLWYVPETWSICFAILFGKDIARVKFVEKFDHSSLLENFGTGDQVSVIYPEILPVMTRLLQLGFKYVVEDQKIPDFSLHKDSDGEAADSNAHLTPLQSGRQPLALLTTLPSVKDPPQWQSNYLAEAAATIYSVIRFLAEVHTKSQVFRDFAFTSTYVQNLLHVLFPAVVGFDDMSPETELHNRDLTLIRDGGHNPSTQTRISGSSIVQSIPATTLQPKKPRISKRMSSYVLVSSDQARNAHSSLKLHSSLSLGRMLNVSENANRTLVQELLKLVMAVLSDQLLSRKEFLGLGLFMKVPPGLQEDQARFESFILQNFLSHVSSTIKTNQKMLCEPKVLANMARFAIHLGESVFEGWFIDGTEAIFEFLASILEYLSLPEVRETKSVRLCSNFVSTINKVLWKVMLLRLSELDELALATETVSFLAKLTFWQTVLLSAENADSESLKLLCYLLYTNITSSQDLVRVAAVNLWRIILVHKSKDISSMLRHTLSGVPFFEGFIRLTEVDNESFLQWIDNHHDGLDEIFTNSLSKIWRDFVLQENEITEEVSKARIDKRKEKLRYWMAQELKNNDIIQRHETSLDHWRSNIYASENLKRQRALQDQQDTFLYNRSVWSRMKKRMHQTCGLFDDSSVPKWQLDQTEGRNRMRIRFIPDANLPIADYQPKRKQSQGSSRNRRSFGTRQSVPLRRRTQSSLEPQTVPDPQNPNNEFGSGESSCQNVADDVFGQDDEFEIIDDPREEMDDQEDKNRKVMRSLQRGDQVEQVHNVSQIIGLEACEGLLIVGKANLYLLDHLFQRSDGEIVNVWQAPSEERDPYLRMISGREGSGPGSFPSYAEQKTRNWRWDEVLNISKRRFLFRDVALEVFFVDGRSYLLTTNTPQKRDELCQKLLAKSGNVGDGTAVSYEKACRTDSILHAEEGPQTFSSRFTSVFSQNFSIPATRKWLKGEISNFHYLMVINTVAGRTFNDLTQYPVFPWVLADYTSEELDLSNPHSFRNFTKPMGCQTTDRELEFKNRYAAFAEMGDHNSPPFHYGTHYSSAMIVTSYLIRLQPFVQSYLLLQGGSFDHPDRLFYSIRKAWLSASHQNMTDVRELIPEFFYLPEFLVNSNEYDFGVRQGDAGRIDNVELPPWAHGDPKIFIAKHRAALESEYVSRNLHHWIDLVFGQKQRGESAVEATNVFHHLSYHGAKNLDTINDPVERLATIGIIHNFGQTPYQVFQRAHPAREELKHKSQGLDTTAESLTRLPFPLLEYHDCVTSLDFSSRHDRIFCSGGFRLNIGPVFDKYIEWGFIDDGIRFYTSDGRKLVGLFEHVHQGQLSTALFADPHTLITAGTDCTVSIWTVTLMTKTVELQAKTTFFGHRSAVTVLATSRSFSALLSASCDGQVLLWDLNRLEFVRKLSSGEEVQCARINDVNGVVMLCRGRVVQLFTLNADPILEQDVCTEGEDLIHACAFYEGSGAEYLERELIFTGHTEGIVNIWHQTIHRGKFVLEHVKSLHHVDPAGFNIRAVMTCVLPVMNGVYTADNDGRVYKWNCIQRQ